jgi:hypothetical protein
MHPLSRLFITALVTLASSRVAEAGGGLMEKPIPDLQAGDLGQVTLIYDPAMSRPHQVTPAEQKEVHDLDSQGVVVRYALETKLTRSGRYFVVACDSGGSADFGCTFAAVGGSGDVDRNRLSGIRFEIPGDNCVYVSGHNDAMFNLHRKFCLDGSRLKETKQPFHYVGLRSKAIHELTFYSDLKSKTPVGTIPQGDPVEVLIANVDEESDDAGSLPAHHHFLVRDKRGLVGWVSLEPTQEARDLEGMFFAGD